MEMDEIEMVGEGRVRSNSARSSGGSDSGGSSGEETESRTDGTWGRAALFDRIMQECRHNSPGQCFSAKVREEIERLEPSARARLVARQRHGAAPLFAACARGALACAEYLVHACGADLEQRGLFRAPTAADLHRVTPLWAAAVAGRLDVLAALADAGADIDAGSDSGSTPLRSACFMTHTAVARFLLARGADVARTNHNGGTCLVNAVQSPELCRLLLDAGAEVDATDSLLKTALHYAVQEHREGAARVLLAAGADPRRESRDGDDALRLAALKGSARLVRQLLELRDAPFGPARAADAHELLGATQLDEYNDAAAARLSWRTATDIRARAGGPPKRPVRAPLAALRHAREWRTREELEAHAHDADWLRTQALLVAVRVLGPTHKDTLFRLMYRGAAYADAFRYSRCVALWSWVLELRVRSDTLLHPETCQTLLALTRLLLEAREARGAPLAARHVAADLLRLLASEPALPECQRLLRVRPQCQVQGDMFDRALRCVVHLAYIAHCAPAHAHAHEPQDEAALEADYREQVSRLVALQLRASGTGDTLLHLACSRLNVVRSTYFANDMGQTRSIFPSCSTVKLLLQCGASVSRRNRARCTPLHVAAIPYNFSTELVETLVSCGAHLDQPNRFGDSPAELVQLNAGSRVRPLQHVTLACRAARALLRRGPAPRDLSRLPATLLPFLRLHQP